MCNRNDRPIATDSLSDEVLCRLAGEGDRNAEELLVTRYTRLARKIARPYFLIGGDSEDLTQEGMIGLMRAIREYSPERAASFRTFAERCIRSRLSSALRDADKVITVLKSYQPAAVSLVINMVRGDMLLSGEILSPKEIEEILKTPILGILPEEDDVFLNNLSDKTRAFKLLAGNLLSDRQKLYDVTRRYSGVIGNIRRILRKGL